MKYLVAVMLLLPVSVQALEVQEVTDGVYAIVGDLGPRTVENLANNGTFGVVVTDEGVVLVDPGGSWLGAAAIDAAIDTVTDQPVKIVINSGGQDHRWIGNGYWKAQGAEIVASNAAVADQKDRGSEQFSALAFVLKDKLDGTEPVYADVTFDEAYDFSLGGVDFEVRHVGAAHTPGDSFVWVPSKDTVFTGDIVYTERMLGVGGQSASASWIEVFEAIAGLNPAHVVPGHGSATDLATATADTYDYLVNLRARMGDYIDEGGDIIDSVKVDQSAFTYLENFDQLAGKNAQRVFEEMEWE